MSAQITYESLSPLQQTIMRIVKASPNMIASNLGGDSRVHYIRAARSLVRKGALIEFRTAQFAAKKHDDKIWPEVPASAKK